MRTVHGYAPHRPPRYLVGSLGYRPRRFPGPADPTSRVTRSRDARCSPTPGYHWLELAARPGPTGTGWRSPIPPRTVVPTPIPRVSSDPCEPLDCASRAGPGPGHNIRHPLSKTEPPQRVTSLPGLYRIDCPPTGWPCQDRACCSCSGRNRRRDKTRSYRRTPDDPREAADRSNLHALLPR